MTKPKAPFPINPESHSARMLHYLRDVFRAQGLRYCDVAESLDVSEKSIKRYMTGRGVTLPLLERLCETAGISFHELSDLAAANEQKEPQWTTPAQESALAADPRAAIVLALLTNGWTAARILRDQLATPSDLNAILLRLDRLDVITLYPNNRTRLKARIRSFNAASPALRRVIAEAGARVLKNVNLTDPRALWRLNYARLGPASVARVEKHLEVFFAEVDALRRQDMDLSGDQVKWYAIFGLLAEHEVLGLKLLEETKL
jgi:transcriptional regulator with XRE-family HTH domain